MGTTRHTLRTRAPRRKSLWLQFEPIQTTMTAPGGSIMFTLNAAALALTPFTVVRSHFELMVRSDQSAAVEQQIVGFGIAVVSDQAVGVGVTAVPTPIVDMGSSLWFVHKLIYGEENRLINLLLPPTLASVDSKAMRKVESGSDIIVVAEMSALGGGAILTVGGRMLIKTN